MAKHTRCSVNRCKPVVHVALRLLTIIREALLGSSGAKIWVTTFAFAIVGNRHAWLCVLFVHNVPRANGRFPAIGDGTPIAFFRPLVDTLV
eukprot:SAG31_NODE_173_length_21354_cov_16.826112_17_plen_91_part_00